MGLTTKTQANTTILQLKTAYRSSEGATLAKILKGLFQPQAQTVIEVSGPPGNALLMTAPVM